MENIESRLFTVRIISHHQPTAYGNQTITSMQVRIILK